MVGVITRNASRSTNVRSSTNPSARPLSYSGIHAFNSIRLRTTWAETKQTALLETETRVGIYTLLTSRVGIRFSGPQKPEDLEIEMKHYPAPAKTPKIELPKPMETRGSQVEAIPAGLELQKYATKAGLTSKLMPKPEKEIRPKKCIRKIFEDAKWKTVELWEVCKLNYMKLKQRQVYRKTQSLQSGTQE